jgi:hypothetical protein
MQWGTKKASLQKIFRMKHPMRVFETKRYLKIRSKHGVYFLFIYSVAEVR